MFNSACFLSSILITFMQLGQLPDDRAEFPQEHLDPEKKLRPEPSMATRTDVNLLLSSSASITAWLFNEQHLQIGSA